MIIRCKLMDPRAVIPRKTEGNSGLDLYVCAAAVVNPGQTVRVDTGVAVEIPDGMTGLVLPRSGLSLRGQAIFADCVDISHRRGLGVIDPSYRGSISVIAHNTSVEPWQIREGDRVAQLVIVASPEVTLDVVHDLSDTSRGTNGFGSTGR